MEAPEIPGLSFVTGLGAGGFADVYLYDQSTPARRVAVKVLRPEILGDGGVERFTAEVNAMAQLEHPHIVPIFWVADTAAGHPYFAMMYYSRGNLAERVRRRPFGVSEVLAVGVQLCGALETAHRSGILHRDVKPANVLVNQFGTIGLTDFGIASRLAATDADQSFSVPWSAPEVLDGTSSGSISSDVYGLAATLWHLLVGRSPFAIPGGDNASDALTERVLSLPAPSTDLDDVPIGLDRLLRRGLAKHPAERPKTMLDFARGLQAVEKAAGYPPTQLVLAADDATSLVRAQMTQSAPLGDEGSRALADGAPATAAPTDWAWPGHGQDALAAALSDFSDAELSGGTAPVPPSALSEPPSDTVRRGPVVVAPENDQVEPSHGPLSTPEASPGLEGGEAAAEDGLSAAAPDTYLPPNSPGRLKLASSPAVSPDTVVHQPRSIGFGASPGEPPYPAQEEGAPTGDHASLETVLRSAPEVAQTRLVPPNLQPSWQDLDRANQPDGPATVGIAAPLAPATSPSSLAGSVPPKPSSDRQPPRIGRRRRLLGVAAVVVGLMMVTGFLALPRPGMAGDATRPVESTLGAPTTPDITEASQLRASDLPADDGTWMGDNAASNTICLPSLGAHSPHSASISFQSTWLKGFAMHRVEVFPSGEDAARAFQAELAEAGGCAAPSGLYIANGWAISSLGEQAAGISYTLQETVPVHHAVVLFRSGRLLNWLDIGRQSAAFSGAKLLWVAAALLRHQTSDAASGSTQGDDARIALAQPPRSARPGRVLVSDFRQIPGVGGIWRNSPERYPEEWSAPRLCESVFIEETKGVKFVIRQGLVAGGEDHWAAIDAFDFPSEAAAAKFFRKISGEFRDCVGKWSYLKAGPLRSVASSTVVGVARGFSQRVIYFREGGRYSYIKGILILRKRIIFMTLGVPIDKLSNSLPDEMYVRVAQRASEVPF